MRYYGIWSLAHELRRVAAAAIVTTVEIGAWRRYKAAPGESAMLLDKLKVCSYITGEAEKRNARISIIDGMLFSVMSGLTGLSGAPLR